MLALSLEGFRPHHLLRLRSALGCHPERSEGSAFLSTSFVSSLRNLQTFQHSSLPTVPRAIPFRIRTSEKRACNPFRIRTSKTLDLKSFRIRTYKKTGGGGPPSNAEVSPAT